MVNQGMIDFPRKNALKLIGLKSIIMPCLEVFSNESLLFAVMSCCYGLINQFTLDCILISMATTDTTMVLLYMEEKVGDN